MYLILGLAAIAIIALAIRKRNFNKNKSILLQRYDDLADAYNDLVRKIYEVYSSKLNLCQCCNDVDSIKAIEAMYQTAMNECKQTYKAFSNLLEFINKNGLLDSISVVIIEENISKLTAYIKEIRNINPKKETEKKSSAYHKTQKDFINKKIKSKSEYRKLLKSHHPDAGGDPESFNRIYQEYQFFYGK